MSYRHIHVAGPKRCNNCKRYVFEGRYVPLSRRTQAWYCEPCADIKEAA